MEHPLFPEGGGGCAGGAGARANRRRLVRLITAASCVGNAAAQRNALLIGGYGHLVGARGARAAALRAGLPQEAAHTRQRRSLTLASPPPLLAPPPQGVCLDSAAAVQQALLGRTTIFPLLLGGEAKFALMSVYAAAEQAGWAYAEEAAALRAALAALPCDALQEPATAADAARRALATLPERSTFTAVAACRRTLEAALRAAERLCPPGAAGPGS